MKLRRPILWRIPVPDRSKARIQFQATYVAIRPSQWSLTHESAYNTGATLLEIHNDTITAAYRKPLPN